MKNVKILPESIEMDSKHLRETVKFIRNLECIIDQVGQEYDTLTRFLADQTENCVENLNIANRPLKEREDVLREFERITHKFMQPVISLLKRAHDMEDIYEHHGLEKE